jgi:hypothetical protein
MRGSRIRMSRRNMRSKERTLEQVPLGYVSPSLVSRMSAASSAPCWNATDNWCSLCKEPHNMWQEHIGKRDHVCLELFYHAMAKEPRSWNPQQILHDYWATWHSGVSFLGHEALGCNKDVYSSQYRTIAEIEEGDITSIADAHGKFLRYFDKAWELPRRTELFAILSHLRRKGFLSFGSEHSGHRSPSVKPVDPSGPPDGSSEGGGGGGPSESYSVIQWQGALVQFKEFHIPMMRLFPNSDQKDLSGLTQMASSNYNLETVFELCQIGRLINPKAFGVTKVDDINYTAKSNVVRDILGQLRFAIEDDSLPIPAAIGGGSRHLKPHDVVLCQLAVRMLVCEIVFCRLSEYICRVDGVWRSQGMPSVNQVDACSTLQMANSSHAGMVSLISSRFHDPEFGDNLNQDPRAPRRRSVQFFYDFKGSGTR